MNIMKTQKNLIHVTTFIIILIMCNTHLLLSQAPSWSLFRVADVAHGEWWRILTHPFTHVSLYHLVIDVVGTIILFSQLNFFSTGSRLLLFAGSSAASLLSVVLFSPYIDATGYCGLSGTAHGLMSFLGLQWIFNKRNLADGWKGLVSGLVFILSSAGKGLFEVISRQVLFSNMHAGDLGTPLVHAHLGGAIGGILIFTIMLLKKREVDGESTDLTGRSRCVFLQSCDRGL